MLRVTHLADFLARIQFAELKLSVTKKDETGDFIETFDSEMSFQRFKSSVLDCRVCRDKIVDMGISFIELRDVLYVDGIKVHVGIYGGVGDLGYGTTLRMVVKSIDFYDDGRRKSFLSFRDLNRYRENKGIA